MLNVCSIYELLAVAMKNYAKADINVFLSCLLLLDSLTSNFFRSLSLETNFCLWLVPASLKNQYLGIYHSFGAFIKRLLNVYQAFNANIKQKVVKKNSNLTLFCKDYFMFALRQKLIFESFESWSIMGFLVNFKVK